MQARSPSPTGGQGNVKRSPRWDIPEQQPLLADELDDQYKDLQAPETWLTWFEETKVVAKYTLPVFG